MDSIDGLQKQVEIGRQAEEFLGYIAERPYFNSLLERLSLELARQVLSLSAKDLEEFTTLQIKRETLSEIIEAARGDVQVGAHALSLLNGATTDAGSLL